MNILEIDFRYSSIELIITALADAMKNLGNAWDKAIHVYERDMIVEDIESLLGIAFVTAQTYITGTVSDVSRIAKSEGKFSKEVLMRNYSEKIANIEVTQLELCDAIANYSKHHDEWERDWTSPRPQQKKTVASLRAVGIDEKTEYPCRKAADILWSHNDSGDLLPLLSLISGWRKTVIESLKRSPRNSIPPVPNP